MFIINFAGVKVFQQRKTYIITSEFEQQHKDNNNNNNKGWG